LSRGDVSVRARGVRGGPTPATEPAAGGGRRASWCGARLPCDNAQERGALRVAHDGLRGGTNRKRRTSSSALAAVRRHRRRFGPIFNANLRDQRGRVGAASADQRPGVLRGAEGAQSPQELAGPDQFTGIRARRRSQRDPSFRVPSSLVSTRPVTPIHRRNRRAGGSRSGRWWRRPSERFVRRVGICFEIHADESWRDRPSGHLRVQSSRRVDDHHVRAPSGAPR